MAYERSKGVKEPKSEHIASENYKNGASHFTYLHPLAECCALTSDLNVAVGRQHCSNFLVEAKNEQYNQGMVVTSELSNEGEECICSICESEKSHLVEFLSNANVNTLNQCNSKERISTTGKNRSVSKEKDDSCESVGSINSKGLIVTGKRVVSFGEEMLMGSKRMKKSSDKNSSSGLQFREGSSFIHWMSSVTNCHFKSDNMDTQSLALVNKQRDDFSTAMSNGNNNEATFRNVGFGSMFKALYYPRLKGKSMAISVDHPGESGSSKDLQFDNITVACSTDRMLNDDKQIKMNKPVPISSVRIGQGVCHLGECPSIVPNISMSSSPVQDKVKHIMREHCDLHHVGSSISYLQSGSNSHSEGKEASKLCPIIPHKSSDSPHMNKAGRIPASAWITRFSSKIGAPVKSITECKYGSLLEAEKCIEDIDSVRECKNTEVYHQSPLGDQRHNSDHLKQYSVSTMGLCSKKVHNDLKAKSNLNPILPSHKLKKLDPIASVFAKRLDAFRHIRTLEVADNITLENPNCFFCGHSGHTITSCSDVVESELKDLLKNICSLGRMEAQECVCIRCFQNDHWAVVCPFAFLSSHHHNDGSASMSNFENFIGTTEGGNDSPLLCNNFIRVCKKGEDRQCQLLSSEHSIPCGDMSRNITEFILQKNINADMKSEMKGKQVASTLRETELRDKSLVNFHNLVARRKPDEQPRVFERIKKLRLSRTAVLRWMESSTSLFSLDGFFLRVRLGKWEEGRGGACYHVACISGTSGNKLHGGYKSHLPVNIGVSKCLIDYRFISNHDFVEDELKAWWSSTLRGGRKPPSKEDLDKKLREMEKLGFLSGLGS